MSIYDYWVGQPQTPIKFMCETKPLKLVFVDISPLKVVYNNQLYKGVSLK